MGITRLNLTVLPVFLLRFRRKEQWGTDSLSEALFKTSDYYPETWFHYIGGNVSKPGITADLEAIAQAGISHSLFHGSGGSGLAFRPRSIPERGLG